MTEHTHSHRHTHTLKPCLLHDRTSGQRVDGAFLDEPNLPDLLSGAAEVVLPSQQRPRETITSSRLCGGNVSGRRHAAAQTPVNAFWASPVSAGEALMAPACQGRGCGRARIQPGGNRIGAWQSPASPSAAVHSVYRSNAGLPDRKVHSDSRCGVTEMFSAHAGTRIRSRESESCSSKVFAHNYSWDKYSQRD